MVGASLWLEHSHQTIFYSPFPCKRFWYLSLEHTLLRLSRFLLYHALFVHHPCLWSLATQVIELVKIGKEIDAIYIARESGLLDKFSPVPLLKSHLQNSKRSSNAMMKRNQSGAYVVCARF
ncbi:hypothetical protein KSP40_PGU007640 [Platanthera guangdongensis]|uniref:FRIGIDA-like protein n=1 Tax=Platanthera guangdongensis TaxID=2320717 RepID=A0ABR2N303_9ASPA